MGEAFNRLDPTGQRVMQALAVYARPVTPAAVDFLLQPAQPGLDSAPVLGRLVNMHFARREAGKFYLHPVDRAYAFERIPRGIETDTQIIPTRSPDDLPDSLQEVLEELKRKTDAASFTQLALLRRAADYFKQARKPRADWKRLDDLAPQLAEFDLRCAAGEYDTAADVLTDIDFNYLLLWGHYRLMAELHERLQGKLNDPTLKMISVASSGLSYASVGQVRKAISCHEQALAIARKGKRTVRTGFEGRSGSADLGRMLLRAWGRPATPRNRVA